MERITYKEVHQKSMTGLNDLITAYAKEGLNFKEQNLAIISGCLIEMNGYLAAIAESLEVAGTKKESTVNEDKIIESYDLLCCDKGTYFRFIYSDHTWEYSDFIISDYQIKYDCDGYSSEEALIAYTLREYTAETIEDYKRSLKYGDFDIEPFDYEKEVKQNGKVQ